MSRFGFNPRFYYDTERIESMFRRMEARRVTKEWSYKENNWKHEFNFFVVEKKIWLRKKLAVAINPSLRRYE